MSKPIEIDLTNQGDRSEGGALPSARAASLRPQPPSASSQSGIPNAGDILTSAEALLHPKTGAMRGLFGDDPPSKLLRIRVGELRRFDAFVRQSRALAQAIEAQRAATAKTGAVEDESAVPEGCAHG